VKHIRKREEPAELRNWRLAQKSAPQNLTYENAPKDALRAGLLGEQGFLCAYTMMRIADTRSGHIEHIRPQSLSPNLQIAYTNMLYCYPGDGLAHCGFGAHEKGGKPVVAGKFVSPLESSCETRFAYLSDGSVVAANDEDEAAANTICVLRLDHRALIEARRQAIRTLPIFDRSTGPVSAQRALRIASGALLNDANGRFQQYAVALCQVMTRYARRRAAKEVAISGR